MTLRVVRARSGFKALRAAGCVHLLIVCVYIHVCVAIMRVCVHVLLLLLLQVAYADLVLLNKMDLCQEEAVATAEADIRAINSSVTILRTSR
jgi:G3E family GTPase